MSFPPVWPKNARFSAWPAPPPPPSMSMCLVDSPPYFKPQLKIPRSIPSPSGPFSADLTLLLIVTLTHVFKPVKLWGCTDGSLGFMMLVQQVALPPDTGRKEGPSSGCGRVQQWISYRSRMPVEGVLSSCILPQTQKEQESKGRQGRFQ